jgi:DNA-binding SARP family transcriptional activator
LRWHLSELRRQAGAALIATQPQLVQLDHRSCWVDVRAFEQLLGHGAMASIAQLVMALQLYRGVYLADIALPDAPEFEMWLLGQRAHYQRRYEQALSSLVEQLVRHGRYADALPCAQWLVQNDALAEPANLQLIRLYARNGQYDAALGHYEQYRQLLYAELQAEPSPAAHALYTEILARRTCIRPAPLTTLPTHRTVAAAPPACSLRRILGRRRRSGMRRKMGSARSATKRSPS